MRLRFRVVVQPGLRIFRAAALLGGTLLCGIGPAQAAVDISTPDFAPVGLGLTAGNLRDVVDGLISPNPSAPEDRPFTLTPSIDVQELVTDNVYQTRSPRLADLVTTIEPQVLLTGQTRLVQASITYAPTVQLYANTSQQDQIFQQFNGSAQITAVPETLFLRLRGFASQQSSGGNYNPDLSPYFSQLNRTNIISVEANPYFTHRFGGWGTVQIGYSYGYTSQTNKNSASGITTSAAGLALETALNTSLLNQTTGQTLQVAGTNITRSNHEYASYTSGENFGRISEELQLDGSQYEGSGNTVLSGSHQSTVTNSFGYAINRTIALLASVGYEDIVYSGTPATRIRDFTWSGGFRLTPNEASSITVTYGHRDGFNALTASASYLVTARLRVLAGYTESLTSSLQEIQSDLANSTVDQYGNNISTVTGAPVLVADQLLSLQNNLYRLSRFSGSAVTTYDRDIFTLTVEDERRTLVATANTTTAFSDHGLSGSFSWSHNLTPALTGAATLRYGSLTLDGSGGGSEQSYSLDLSTSYAFSPTLYGRAEYLLRNQTSNVAGQSYLQNAVVVGLHKSL